MDNNDLYISSAMIDKYSSMANSSVEKLDNTRNTNDTGFSSLRDNGLYTKGFHKIGSRLSVITSTIKNTNNINKAYINKFVSLESEGKKLAEDLIVPKIDNTRSINLVNSYASTNVYKKDGKSVNSGSNNTTINYLNDNYAEDKELLGDITKISEEEVKDLKDYSLLKEELLTSINKKLNTLKVELIDYSGIKDEVLKKVNKELNTYEVELNDIELEKVDLNYNDTYSDEYQINLNDYVDAEKLELSDIKEVNE